MARSRLRHHSQLTMDAHMTARISRRAVAALLLGTSLIASACSKEQKTEVRTSEQLERKESGNKDDDAKETGRIVVVEMYSDANGNYYKPADFEVHRGDIIRFTLKSGVHNVNFLADSNSGKANLPPLSDMLQLPEQTYDLKVTLSAGTYYYQCDPHAALGMKGHIKVED